MTAATNLTGEFLRCCSKDDTLLYPDIGFRILLTAEGVCFFGRSIVTKFTAFEKENNASQIEKGGEPPKDIVG